MTESSGPATQMSVMPAAPAHYLRPGITSITPYIIIERAPEFMDFLKAAFGAEGRSAHDVERQPDIHLYFDDCDAVYQRALAAGATSVFPPTDEHPSGDRWGQVRDAFGNTWDIATPKGWTPGPEGIRTVQPYLHLKEAHTMAPFMESAFGAEVLGMHQTPDGVVMHATIRLGNATLEIDEAHGDYQPKPCHLHIYVPDTDATYKQALRAGASSLQAPYDAPYGDRAAGVKDPFGNSWFLATYQGTK